MTLEDVISKCFMDNDGEPPSNKELAEAVKAWLIKMILEG